MDWISVIGNLLRNLMGNTTSNSKVTTLSVPTIDEYRPAPDRQHKPRKESIHAVIIHNVVIKSGTILASFDDVMNFFMTTESYLSAHYFVDKEKVIQMVLPDRVAYHAGKSILNGRDRVNEFSVGIELMHYDGQSDFTDFQYKWVAEMTAYLMRKHDFDFSNVAKHKDIRGSYRFLAEKFDANIPNKKFDPNGFDWNRFTRKVFG